MIVQDLWRKCKGIVTSKDFLISAIIILVGTGSFGLGRLSVLEAQKVPIKIEYPKVSEVVQKNESLQAAVVLSTGGGAKGVNTPIPNGFVASKSGTKYYLPFCGGVDRIKEENKIWFATKAEAEKAGYGPAANCKGL